MTKCQIMMGDERVEAESEADGSVGMHACMSKVMSKADVGPGDDFGVKIMED